MCVSGRGNTRYTLPCHKTSELSSLTRLHIGMLDAILASRHMNFTASFLGNLYRYSFGSLLFSVIRSTVIRVLKKPLTC